MKKTKIGFVGAGNMAHSLIKGLLADNYPPECIWATNRNPQKRSMLQALGIHIFSDNRLLLCHVDVLVLAVKPQQLQAVCSEIAESVQEKRPLIVCIAAAVNLETLANYFQQAPHPHNKLMNNLALVRAMPNTPASVRCGATGLWANPYCSPQQKELAAHLFRSTGIVVWAESEEEIDLITALSGTGPAYFFLLIEALQKAAVELGLAQTTAAQLSLRTALGAARMATETTDTINILKEKVTSPGGTTAAALACLSAGGFSTLIKNAVVAAQQRAKKMAEQLEQ